jgi:hypothetical protein
MPDLSSNTMRPLPSFVAEFMVDVTISCQVLLVALDVNLRSASSGDLRVPRLLTRRLGPRSFSSSGPAVWTRLPAAIQDPSLTLAQLKRCLKQHFFCIAY